MLISNHTNDAWYQREEVAAAIDLARREGHRVVPVVLTRGIELPYGLRRLHGATALDEQGLRDLAHRLAREATTHPSKPGREQGATEDVPPSSASGRQGIVLIDASHRQEQWGWPSGTFMRAADTLSRGLGQRVDTELAASLASTDPRGSCLILAQPYHTEVDLPTIDAIGRWVGSGGGLLYLGYYLAALHHETNPNELALLLGFEFGPDLLMPPAEHSRTDYQDQAFHDRPEYVVPVTVPEGASHQLTAGVDELALASACSLQNVQSDTELTLTSSPASVIEVTGPKTREGYILQIKDYRETGVETPAVIAAWHHGDGKVVVLRILEARFQRHRGQQPVRVERHRMAHG